MKVNLNSTSKYGQEIEIINIKDFCKEYDELFKEYPDRNKWEELEELEEKINIYNENIDKTLDIELDNLFYKYCDVRNDNIIIKIYCIGYKIIRF